MGGRICTHVDATIAELASAQGGVVGAGQLHARGVTNREIDRRLSSGHLHRSHTGVYVVGHRSPTPDGARWAAVLACGDDAALAGWSNAVHRGLLSADGMRINVAVPVTRSIRRAGVAVTRVVLYDDEIESVRGLRCTSVARMLLEISASKPAAVVERVWRNAAYQGALDTRAVSQLLTRRRGDRGIINVRALYARREELVGRLNGHAEDLVLPIIRRTRLGEPRINDPIWVGRRFVTVDFHFPGRRLVIEADGRQAHSDPEQLEQDARRDAELNAIGVHVHRVRYADARWRPGEVERSLRALETR